MVTAAATAVILAVGLHNVLFWTVAFFLLSFIPELGVTVGSIAPALFALLQFPTAWQAIVIFAVIQVAAFIVGTVVYPRLQARAQNIDPITTIVALSFWTLDRKSTRLNSSHLVISYAVFCLKKKKNIK